MTRIVIQSRVGSDGILRLAVPVGSAAADHQMQVIIEPVTPILSKDANYKAWLDQVAGKWQEDFERLPIMEFEKRDSF